MSFTTPESYLALSRLATTNHPPSTQDDVFIREVVGGLDRRADEIRNQLQLLEQDLQDVERDRKFFRPMLSPLRRMPLEILGEIFVFLAGIDRRYKMLATISQVCKMWRRAAHLVPRLWCKVSLDPSSPSLSYEGVSAWLGRAGSLPRSVHLDSRKCDTPLCKKGLYVGPRCLGEGKCVLSKIDVAKILKETPFLQHISIQPPTYQCLHNLIDALGTIDERHPWTQITSFAIEIDWEFHWPNHPLSLDTSLIPPSVTSLQLELADYEDIPTRHPKFEIHRTVLRGLTSLNITCDWPGEHIFNPLRYCTNLKTLVLDLGYGDLHWSTTQDLGSLPPMIQSGIPLPRLRVLHLDNVRSNVLKQLRYLKTPALREFRIQFGPVDWAPGEDADTLYQALTNADLGASFATFLRSDPGTPPSLESLHITNGVLDESTLCNSLRAVPSLKHLGIDNSIFLPDTFIKLSAPEVLPVLRTLELSRLHLPPGELLGLQAFVDKRGVQVKTSRCRSDACEVGCSEQ